MTQTPRRNISGGKTVHFPPIPSPPLQSTLAGNRRGTSVSTTQRNLGRQPETASRHGKKKSGRSTENSQERRVQGSYECAHITLEVMQSQQEPPRSKVGEQPPNIETFSVTENIAQQPILVHNATIAFDPSTQERSAVITDAPRIVKDTPISETETRLFDAGMESISTRNNASKEAPEACLDAQITSGTTRSPWSDVDEVGPAFCLPSLSAPDDEAPLPSEATASKDDFEFIVLCERYIFHETFRVGVGRVFKGFDVQEKCREVMIKIWSAHPLVAWRRVPTEVEILRRCHNRHIVRMQHVYRTAHGVHAVMRHVEGGPLVTFLGEDPPRWNAVGGAVFPKVASQLSAAVLYLHERCIVHRDIAPRNVVMDHEGRVVLCGFDVAEFVKRVKSEESADEGGARCRGYCGTPLFMAPEVVALRNPRGGTVDGYKADIYSLGVTLFVALTGRLPFSTPGNSAGDVLDLNGVPANWHGVLTSMLERDGRRRPPIRKIHRIINTMPGTGCNGSPRRASLPFNS